MVGRCLSTKTISLHLEQSVIEPQQQRPRDPLVDETLFVLRQAEDCHPVSNLSNTPLASWNLQLLLDSSFQFLVGISSRKLRRMPVSSCSESVCVQLTMCLAVGFWGQLLGHCAACMEGSHPCVRLTN